MLTEASREQGAAVKLPFLALSRRTTDGPVPVECPGIDRHGLAFTTLIDAGSYLQESHSVDLEIELIFRQSVDQYLDGLERHGFLGVGFDANCDSATVLALTEMRTMFSL